jgi:hypothetical protein
MRACLLYVLHILFSGFEKEEGEKKNEKFSIDCLILDQANRIDTYKYTNVELPYNHR